MSTQENTTGKNTLVSKLAEVMREVSKIPKNGKNTFHNYKYVMESDLVEAVRDKLAERHIFITSSTKGIETVELSKPTKGGEIVTQKIGILRVEYTFHDGESGEKLTMEGAGEIDQDGGKGLYKALTGAMKYFLMKQFLVATGDDPEQTPQQKSEHVKKAAPPKPAAKAPPTVIQIMEHLTKCERLQPLQTIYSAACKYDWKPEEAASIGECFVNVYGKLSNWPLHDATSFYTVTGDTLARIERDEKGRVTVIDTPAPAAPEAVPAAA